MCSVFCACVHACVSIYNFEYILVFSSYQGSTALVILLLLVLLFYIHLTHKGYRPRAFCTYPQLHNIHCNTLLYYVCKCDS